MEIHDLPGIIPIDPYGMLSALLASLMAVDDEHEGEAHYKAQIEACAAGLDDVVAKLSDEGMELWGAYLALALVKYEEWSFTHGG